MTYPMKPSRIFPTGLLAGTLALGALRALAGHDEEEGDPRFRVMDTNGDGRVSQAEHVTAARSSFARMDADHDGYLTAAELDAQQAQQKDAALRFSVSTQTEGPDRGLGSGAARADGSVSANEVANARTAAPSGPTAADQIRLADRDGDGRLTAAEHAAAAAAVFARLDADGDGFLSKLESEAGRAIR